MFVPSIAAVRAGRGSGGSTEHDGASGVNEAGTKAGELRCTFLTLSRVTRDDAV
jgi:hypothetical protein